MGKCCLENCADKLAQCWAAIDLQFVKKRKKKSTISVDCSKLKYKKLRYACTSRRKMVKKNAGPSFLHCPPVLDLSPANLHCLVSSLTPSEGFLMLTDFQFSS